MKTSYLIKNITQNNIAYTNNNNYLLTSNLLCALQTKNIIVSNIGLSEKETINNLELGVFYRGNKIKNYKLRCKKTNKRKENKLNTKLTNLFNNKNLKINLKNLNKSVDKRKLVAIFKKLKSFSNKLFAKRINLFLDFLKIVLLVENKKASIWTLVYIMSLIFKPLQKRQHGMFISFINQVFKYLINRKKGKKINGIKLMLSGRLKGKPRAKYAKMALCNISLTQYKANIQAAQSHIYTIYGCFGLKLWINFRKLKKKKLKNKICLYQKKQNIKNNKKEEVLKKFKQIKHYKQDILKPRVK